MFHYKDDDRIITNEDKKLIKNTFVKYSSSKDKTGLNKVDYKVAWLFLFGYKPSKYEAQKMFNNCQKDYYKDELTYGEFEGIVINQMKHLDLTEEIRNAFIAMDFSCKGFLTLDDFQKAFKIVAPNISDKIVNNVFRELDRDCDNRVSYKDFEFAIQYYDDQSK